jgi:hypothetical protein
MSAIKQDGPYDSRTLTKVFCGSSVALAASVGWMVLDDHYWSRPWKAYQESFRHVEVARAQAEQDDAERTLNRKALEQVEADLKAAATELDKQSDRVTKLEADLKVKESTLEQANLQYSIAKSEWDSSSSAVVPCCGSNAMPMLAVVRTGRRLISTLWWRILSRTCSATIWA